MKLEVWSKILKVVIVWQLYKPNTKTTLSLKKDFKHFKYNSRFDRILLREPSNCKHSNKQYLSSGFLSDFPLNYSIKELKFAGKKQKEIVLQLHTKELNNRFEKIVKIILLQEKED